MSREIRAILNEMFKSKPEVEITEGHGVFLKGGSIGSKHDPAKPIKVHDNEEDAKAHAKRMNKLLSPGEKSYYGMKYHVKPVTSKND